MTSEFKKNLPHIIAIALLIFALLIVSTKAGLVRCSDLGKGFCQVMDSLFGRPKVILVYGDEGIGDPDKLKQQVEALWKLPVREAHVDDLSAGMLDQYSLVIVEKARNIPTSKLKLFNDYIMTKVDGRLVWIGDSGTFGGPDDSSCRTLEFTVNYRLKEANTTRYTSTSHQLQVCVSEKELDIQNATLFQSTVLRSAALQKKAADELYDFCDSFSGQLQLVKEQLGYKCELPPASDYSEMYFDWGNEEEFKNIINPWNRGNYSVSWIDEQEPGIEFGTYVLGLSFIADDFAVKNYQEYEKDLDAIQEELFIAHDGFIACRRLLSETGCSYTSTLAKVRMDLSEIKTAKSGIDMDLSGFLTELKSIKTNKALANDSSAVALLDSAISLITEKKADILALKVQTEEPPTPEQLTELESMAGALDDVKMEIAVLEGSESDDALKQQYESMRSKVNQTQASLAGYLSDLDAHTREYELCKAEGASTLQGALVKKLGEEYEGQIETTLSYSSRQTTKNSVLSFMTQATDDNGLTPTWEEFRNRLAAIDESEVCKGDSPEASEAFRSLVDAFDMMDSAAKTETKWEALATLTTADYSHLLVRGIAPSVELKYELGNKSFPVPFVLVGNIGTDAQVVSQIDVVPTFAGRESWPAITAREPKFGTHVLGRGTVVYYAFPPETEEELVNNMVEFLLY